MFARWWDNFQESCDIRLAAGCGCAVAWVLLVAVSPVLSTASTFLEGGFTWRSGLVAGALTTFFVMVVLGGRLRVLSTPANSSPTVPLLAAAALLSPAGAILHNNATGSTAAADGILAAWAGLLTGCGMAMLIAGWSTPFSAVRLRKRVVGTVASVFFGCALYFAIASLPPAMAFAASLALAPASLFLAMLIGRFPISNENGEATQQTGSPKQGEQAIATPARDIAASAAPCQPISHLRISHLLNPELSLATIVYGALFVLAGHVLPEIEDAWMASTLPGLANVGAFLVSEVFITLYMVKRIRHENPRVAYRPAAILVAVGFLLLPFVGATGSLLCMAIAFAGFGCFLIYLWIVLGNLSQRWEVPPIPVTSFGLLLVFAGIVIGEIATWMIYRAPISIGYSATVSVISLFLLVMLSWAMTDGSRYAQETLAMGGVPTDAGGRDGYSPAEGSGAAASLGDSAPSPDKDKLQAAAETYGLSPREVEVAALLLRGRSIPYICDELFIAKSTAQTHVRHIYAKMDITGGRQELIDRLEG